MYWVIFCCINELWQRERVLPLLSVKHEQWVNTLVKFTSYCVCVCASLVSHIYIRHLSPGFGVSWILTVCVYVCLFVFRWISQRISLIGYLILFLFGSMSFIIKYPMNTLDILDIVFFIGLPCLAGWLAVGLSTVWVLLAFTLLAVLPFPVLFCFFIIFHFVVYDYRTVLKFHLIKIQNNSNTNNNKKRTTKTRALNSFLLICRNHSLVGRTWSPHSRPIFPPTG